MGGKLQHIIKDWIVTTLVAFFLYELLWRLLTHDNLSFWGIDEYLIDLCYCSLFTLTSVFLSNVLSLVKPLNSLTDSSQLARCIIMLTLNMCIAYGFEKAYNWVIPSEDTEVFWKGVYLFCIIASLLTLLQTSGNYYRMAVKQNKELVDWQKKALRSQLNPHFVFNSLNSLAELIHSNPDTAEEYVLRLSRAYRYVLSHLENDYARLDESCSFVCDYVALQQLRVPGKITLAIDDMNASMCDCLFSLSMQVLVENAIKHSFPVAGQELKIMISRHGDEIVMRNNLLGDSKAQASFGLGLETLIKRYRLEGMAEPVITLDDRCFEVKMKLLCRESLS